MTNHQEKICDLLDATISEVNTLLEKSNDKNKVIELLNVIQEPVLRRLVKIQTGLWN